MMLRLMPCTALKLAGAVLLALTLAAPLAGCGKVGPNEPPEDSRYPRPYPSQ